MKKILVFDTTLRDGEQGGHPILGTAKLKIAHALERVGVDVIEAGFPCSSPEEVASVRRIARQVRGPVICALARIKQVDIDPALRALEQALRPRLHVFASTSSIHIERKLRSTPQRVLEETGLTIAYARRFLDDIEFSAEDATRTDLEYLAQIVRVAIQAGATTINLPDTVGYATPGQITSMLDSLYRDVPQLQQLIVSMHCHNDLGLAVANTIAGVEAGARQIEGCFLGIGERAGNVALEQAVMILETRGGSEYSTNISRKEIGPLCRLISSEMGYPIPAHHPIVGSLAFAHSSGIHRDGVDKDRRTYEIMEPEAVGWSGISLELTSRMGRNGLRTILDSMGYDGTTLIDRVYPAFIELADRKVRLSEEDVHMIVQEIQMSEEAHRDNLFEVVSIDYRPRWGFVEIRRNGTVKSAEADGDGAIDAVFKAIHQAIHLHGEDLTGLSLDTYTVNKGEGGTEAIGWVMVRASKNNRKGFGRSGNPDVVTASARAHVRAINHLLRAPVTKIPEATL